MPCPLCCFFLYMTAILSIINSKIFITAQQNFSVRIGQVFCPFQQRFLLTVFTLLYTREVTSQVIHILMCTCLAPSNHPNAKLDPKRVLRGS